VSKTKNQLTVTGVSFHSEYYLLEHLVNGSHNPLRQTSMLLQDFTENSFLLE